MFTEKVRGDLLMAIEAKTLQVVGRQTMHCGGCETTGEFVVKQLAGIQQVKANYKTQEINLAFDPQALNLERVRQELDGIGYQLAEIEGS